LIIGASKEISAGFPIDIDCVKATYLGDKALFPLLSLEFDVGFV
jgi:hypothetical protein